MLRRLIAFGVLTGAVLSSGCTPGPEKVCKKLAGLEKKTLSKSDIRACEEGLTKAKKKDPEFYACAAKCFMGLERLDGVAKCAEDCPKKKKTARAAAQEEARQNLGIIEKGSGNAYEQETDTSGVGAGPFVHRFCPSSSEPVPAKMPKGKAVSEANAWNTETWKCLHFQSLQDIRCQYAYKSSGTGEDAKYKATAVCDPDGDGKLLEMSISGKGTAHSHADWEVKGGDDE